MTLSVSSWFRQMAKVGGVSAFLLMSASASHADSGVFAGYAGTWSGNGTISIADGGDERIRCRGTYTIAPDGNTLHQSLRCASDSYRFDLVSEVRAQGTYISGTWSETSRNVTGTLDGRINNGNIEALVTTNAFAATLSMAARGNRQSFSISSKGELRGVTITLARSN